MTSSDLKLAYILHQRAYLNTSLLITLYTVSEGKTNALVKGAKRPKHWSRGMLQSFTPLLVGLSGRSGLKQLTKVESSVPTPMAARFSGNRLYAAMYVNELMMRLCPEGEADESLYDAYQQVIIAIEKASQAQDTSLQIALRVFEVRLLSSLGFALPERDCFGEMLTANQYYQYEETRGFVPVSGSGVSTNATFEGAVLQAVIAQDWQVPGVLRVAKFAHQALMQPLLGVRPLQSKMLLQSKKTNIHTRSLKQEVI